MNYSGTTISSYVTTFKSIIKFQLAKEGRNAINNIDEREKFINSGENIDSLDIIKLIHGICSASRCKLVSVPEPKEVLVERNNWEDWKEFKETVNKGIFLFQFFKYFINN